MGAYMAWLYCPPLGADATGRSTMALPLYVTTVVRASANIGPTAVCGSQDRLIGPAIRAGVLHDAPALVEEMKP